MDHVKTHRYLLITSTIPAQGLRDRFEAVTDTGDYVALIWPAAGLTRLLDAHPQVRARHFPPEPKPALTQPRRFKIFLCHTSGDKPAVRGLYHRLRAEGFDPWLDKARRAGFQTCSLPR